MQIDQLLRRLFWRVRRSLRPGADHDPVYTVEPPPHVAPAKEPGPSRTARLRRTVIAFMATFAVLALGYGVMAAMDSRTPLDTARPPYADVGGSRSLAAAISLLGPSTGVLPGAEAVSLLPNGRKLRIERIDAGKRAVAAAYATLSARETGGQNPALETARAAMDAGDFNAARDALVQSGLHTAPGGASAVQRASQRAALVSAIAEAAAMSCAAEEVALRDAAAGDTGGLAGPVMQSAFSHSRGLAYGWLMLLRGALADAPEIASQTVVEAAIPLDALAAAAEHQPLFLFNGSDRAPWAPAHVEIQSARFARAAVGARALALAAAKEPAKKPAEAP